MKSMMMALGLGLAVIYLISQFFPEGISGSFTIPGDSQYIVVVFQILLLAAVAVGAFGLAKMFGQPMGKRDVWTLVIIALLIWFAWDNVLSPFLGDVGNIGDITVSVVKKVGLVP